MAKYSGSKCRLCRREGTKLFLKGSRCVGPNCAFDKRSYSPGQHGKDRVKLSNYGIQLREKQKVKRIYGILERQFRKYFVMASRSKGKTGEKLLELLENRLDNAIFRLNFATTRVQARQIVGHNHVSVNGRRINIPSYLLKKGDVIQLKGKEKFIKAAKETAKVLKDRGLPSWLEQDEENLKGTALREPIRADVQFPIKEQLIVELYSK